MSLVRRSLTLAVVGSLALSGLTIGASAADEPKARAHDSAPKAEPVARGLIIKTTTAKPTGALLKAAGVALDADADIAGTDGLTGNISTVDFDEVVSLSVAKEAAVELAKRRDVVWAVPNSLRRAAADSPVPRNDPAFDQQTNVWDSAFVREIGGYSIMAPYLWRATEGDAHVVVAVVDGGITNHPDLEGQTVPGYDMIDADQFGDSTPTFEVAGDGNGRDNDPSDPGDWATDELCGEDSISTWHGTSIAGTIAAKSDNNEGIAGIAPGVRVQPVRVLGHCSAGWDSDILAGITWATGGHVSGVPDNPTPAKVVNLSISGYPATDYAAECTPYQDVAAAARARGAVLIAAAGNDGSDANTAIPSSCSGYVSVGATTRDGASSPYSNYGSRVDLVAPGGGTYHDGIYVLTNTGMREPEFPNIEQSRGTSFAAAEVSAAAALLASEGDYSPAEIETALVKSVSPFRKYDKVFGALNCVGTHDCGSGILNLGKIQASISGAKISGNVVVGEPLTATPGTWTASPTSFKYIWLRDGTTTVGTNSPTYHPTRDDRGSEIAVKVSPATGPYAKSASTSAPTAVVPDGPDVTITTASPTSFRFGSSWTATVNLEPGTVDGPVELRRGNTVLAAGSTVDGTADLTVTGTRWLYGANVVRAAYLGSDGAASSVGTTVTVARAIPQLLWTLPTSIKKSQNAKMVIRVRVPGVLAPTGLIDVYDGSKKIMSFSMGSGYKGLRTVFLPKLKKGTHKIKFRYVGLTTIAGATSTTRSIKIK